MHPELLKSTVQACRDHIEGGDRRGPVDNVPAERLMFAVAQLADELDKLRAAGVALPHAPSEAEVRLAFEKRMLDFGWRNFDGDLRGEPKCWYYDNTDLCARWIGWREAVRAAAGVKADRSVFADEIDPNVHDELPRGVTEAGHQSPDPTASDGFSVVRGVTNK